MNIFIPTYGRAERQETLRQLLAAGVPTNLVVQAREAEVYQRLWGDKTHIIVLPDTIRTIAPTRQYILEYFAQDHFCMVDDDLFFYTRRADDPTKLREITPLELHGAFDHMAGLLTCYGHAGFAAREGANRNTEEFVYNTRIMRVLGYNKEMLLKSGARFDAMEVMEDFHVALSMLESGYPNIILNLFAHNQAGGSGDKGGCSHFRTPELQAENAKKLAAKHPAFVSVVNKTTKGAWGGGTRTDVQVQWKRAFASSQTKIVSAK